MGKGSKPTIGYWYKPAFHVGLGIGPIDAYREFRGGDKTAWAGNLTASGTITINAPNLWGGEKDQGGIVGAVDVMFGEATQMPNPYLIATFGPQQPAWRGLTTLVFKGGKYGAMNPYPHPASHKIVKILKGWDGDVCWYPEKATIVFEAGTGNLTKYIAFGPQARPSADGLEWSRVAAPAPFLTGYAIGAGDRFVAWDASAAFYTTDMETWQSSTGFLGGSGGQRMGVYFGGAVLIAGGITGYHVTKDKCATFEERAYPGYPRLNLVAASSTLMVGMSLYDPALKIATSVDGPWSDGDEHNMSPGDAAYDRSNFFFIGADAASGLPRVITTENGSVVVDLTLPSFASASFARSIAFAAAPLNYGAIVMDSGEVTWRDPDGVWQLSADILGESARGLRWVGSQFIMWGATTSKASVTGENWTDVDLGMTGIQGIATGAVIDTRTPSFVGMNPAHALYYARTHREIGREPIANINDASYRAAADKLYAEGFGICIEYDPSAESLIEYEQRICNLIGGSINRSLVDGQYYLDLARGDYVLEDLPILTDDDILSFAEQPSILDNAINSASVKYFDPERKETIVTPPVQALALIDAFGTIHQVNDYPEIPTAALAATIAERDLRNNVTPTRAFDLATKRKPYGWRPNTYFRLQAPKRGIADLVCLLGSKETGTLKSGAIKIAAVQDIYNLPAAAFVEVEHGVDTRPPQTPVPIDLQRAFEAPYIEVAATLSRADLAVLPEETGYLLAVAADPSVSRNYTMRAAPDGGAYIEAGSGDWCPTALVVEAASIDPDETEFTLASGSRLGQVEVGSAVLWDDELCRVDAIDATALTITLGRACADTVPMEHAAGSRLWFYDGDVAFDTTEYTDGETINVKLLTNTGSQQLSEDLAISMSLTFDQRQFRPYPPANVTINGAWPPLPVVTGTFTLAWAHRDRVLQADQLVDWSMASIGPEPGVTCEARFYDVDTGDLLFTTTPTSGDTVDVLFTFTGTVRMEFVSTRGSVECWQAVGATFFYSNDVITLRLLEDGTPRLFEDGTPRIIEV